MNRHPLATTLAIILANRDDFDELLQASIEMLFDEYTDERKADLYAMLAERVTPQATFDALVDTVSRTLWDNENFWAARHG